jgi:CO dehydrogenase/acetyl-CoA synthase delta subunit
MNANRTMNSGPAPKHLLSSFSSDKEGEVRMNDEAVIKAMDRIEALLADVEKSCPVGGIVNAGEVVHCINNARQVAAGVRVLLEDTEPPEPDMNADGPAERAHRDDEARRMK